MTKLEATLAILTLMGTVAFAPGMAHGGDLGQENAVSRDAQQSTKPDTLESAPAYYAATEAEIEAEQEFLAEIERFHPDPEQWYFVKRFEPQDLTAPRADFDDSYEFAENPAEDEDSPDLLGGDLLLMALPDGRVYAQHWWTQRSEKSAPSRTSTIADEPAPDLDDSLSFDGFTDVEDSDAREGSPKQVIGSDNRRRTTSTWPGHRGVMVRLQSGATSTDGFCSGAMISPRVVLTAAHCVVDSKRNTKRSVVYVAPAARGASYDGQRLPQGARLVTGTISPNGWDGVSTKYDYAMLTLADHARDTSGSVHWTPTPVRIGYQTTSWLEARKFNLFGYPGWNRQCADAAPGDGGLCNGYAYRQSPSNKIHQAHSTWLSHTHDTQPGQSGAPLYTYDGSSRTVFGIHQGTAGSRNSAHRIRPGSFNSMCRIIEDNPSSHFPNVWCEETASIEVKQWQPVRIGDCTGNDVFETAGWVPDENVLRSHPEALTVVCWDQYRYINDLEQGPRCTYKTTPTDQCVGGEHPGVMYSR